MGAKDLKNNRLITISYFPLFYFSFQVIPLISPLSILVASQFLAPQLWMCSVCSGLQQ